MKINHLFGLFAIVCGQIGCGLFLVDGSETRKASTTAPATMSTETDTNSSTTGSTTSSSIDTSTTTETETVTGTTTTTQSGTGGAGGSNATTTEADAAAPPPRDEDAGAPQPDAETDAGNAPDAEAPDASAGDAGQTPDAGEQHSPTVTFTYGAYYQSAIVVPHPWDSAGLDGMDVQNAGDTKQKIVQLTIELVSSNSDFADFRFIGIGGGAADWNGKLVDTLPAYPATSITVDLSKDPIVLPPHSSYPLMLSGSFNDVVSSAACPSGHGCARSGHTPMLQITGAVVSDGIVNVPAHTTPLVVLRQSQPIITKQELANTTLVNADQDLFKFQVSADTTGPIGIKHFELVYTKSKGFSISDLRLRRGDVNMPLDSYRILHGWPNPLDCMAGPCIDKMDNGVNSPIAIELVNEEFIQGSGVTYTLHGTVQDVAAENFLIFGFGWTGLDTNLTGCLTTLDDGISLQTNGSNSGGSIFWSDLSEAPHSSAMCDQSGSLDWTNGYLVQGTNQSQKLSL